MGSAPSSLKREVHEELSCSICLELFTRPKVLPCQHTFCQDCLQDHAGRGGTFQCPNCRRHVRLPPQGVAGLPDSHIVANMCEKFQKQEKLFEETKAQPQSGKECSFHPTEEVKLYCKQCYMPVCIECCEGSHDGHPTTGLNKAAQERRSTVQALINEGRNILESYCSFIRGLGQKEKTLNDQRQQRDNGITHTYNQMMQKLTERKDHLLSESQQNYSKNLKKIQTERDKVLADVNELSAACDRAEKEMEQGGVKFLSKETILTGVLGKYRGKAAPTHVQTQPAVFQPTDTPVPVLGHVTVQSLSSAPITAAPAPIPAASATSSQAERHRGKAAPTPVQTQPAVFQPTDTPVPVWGHVQSLLSAPAARGRGYCYGNQRQGQHQSQRVTFGGKGSGPGQFKAPRGVTVSDEGEIFVADSGNHRIQVFTMQGTFVRQFPTVVSGEQKMEPYNVALDGEGNLWVVGETDSADFAVQYNKQGRVLRKFDLQKSGGLTIDNRRNHILIAQITGDWRYLHREVLVFRPDGTLVRKVGRQQGMENPQYITVDGEGNIIVSDRGNDCVFVYNKDGQFVFRFGGLGRAKGKLCSPNGICTDRAGNIIVADTGNHQVAMFDKTGKFLKHIFTDIQRPLAITMATQGQLIVTDNKNYKVTILPNPL
ncbi:TRIM71 [Branchiostoma lanceolatum]|uniref:RING-type E3 ubiquitin transferase n=1 Tax=Branchiostoma lanceolatum TaxID=7740 RepID=A0A8K0AEL5_BRALA|nr:TRIM71 [Branchiostoma lanceolatum]